MTNPPTIINKNPKKITRRQFLTGVALTGGSVYTAMVALDLLKTPSSETLPPQKTVPLWELDKKKRVIILGGGLAGMCAAYELGKLGYDCHILEARNRPGGRCWTIRQGTTETEINGQQLGQKQVAQFDETLYFNPGPARIPQHHHSTLHYCKEFGVAVEVFSNVNEGAYYYTENGPLKDKPIRIRQTKNDMRGYISELLSKAITQDALDLPLTPQDKQKLLAFLTQEGDLDQNHLYQGSSRRGYRNPPGGGLQSGQIADPFKFEALIQSGLGSYFSDKYSYNQQPIMLQIKGGTDQLAQAFAKRVINNISYQAEVQEIRHTPKGVKIVYSDQAGTSHSLTGDYCICTIPLPVLQDIKSDFSSEMKSAIRAISYVPTGKIGLQFSRRFWETDEHIFGGISTTSLSIGQIWYPASDYLSQKGIIVGYYNFGPAAIEFGNLSLKDRQKRALAEGAKIHPQYTKSFENAFSVSWHKIKYSLGGFAMYSPTQRKNTYPILNKADANIYLAGEHISYLTGWMAGAFESALGVVKAIHERVLNEV